MPPKRVTMGWMKKNYPQLEMDEVSDIWNSYAGDKDSITKVLGKPKVDQAQPQQPPPPAPAKEKACVPASRPKASIQSFDFGVSLSAMDDEGDFAKSVGEGKAEGGEGGAGQSSESEGEEGADEQSGKPMEKTVATDELAYLTFLASVGEEGEGTGETSEDTKRYAKEIGARLASAAKKGRKKGKKGRGVDEPELSPEAAAENEASLRAKELFGDLEGREREWRENHVGEILDKSCAWNPAWEYYPNYTEQDYNHQASLGAQSMRKRTVFSGHAAKKGTPHSLAEARKYFEGVFGKDKHATQCFMDMLQKEKELAGEYVVFYHSYSFAAILYEVQSALAGIIYGLRRDFPPVPRILKQPFAATPTVMELVKMFNTMHGQDHDPRFRALAISASTSVFAPQSEAPPPSVWSYGYSCSDLSFVGVLKAMLTKCGYTDEDQLAKKIVSVAKKYGLSTSNFGGSDDASLQGHQGHLLQIFVKRFLVNTCAYASRPFGVPIPEEMPFSKFLDTEGPFEGQARVFMHPSFFTSEACTRMFVYSAHKPFHEGRKRFREELIKIMEKSAQKNMKVFQYHFPELPGEREEREAEERKKKGKH